MVVVVGEVVAGAFVVALVLSAVVLLAEGLVLSLVAPGVRLLVRSVPFDFGLPGVVCVLVVWGWFSVFGVFLDVCLVCSCCWVDLFREAALGQWPLS